MDDGSLCTYGPGALFRRHECGDVAAATLEHSRMEQELVHDGWSLEQMTTERRSGLERRHATRGSDRRRSLKLVR
jgi:hypothetical protein